MDKKFLVGNERRARFLFRAGERRQSEQGLERSKRLLTAIMVITLSYENVLCNSDSCKIMARNAVRVYDKVLTEHMPPLQRELMDSVFIGLDSLKPPQNLQSRSLTVCENASYSAFQNGDERWVYMSERNGTSVLLLLESDIHIHLFPVYGELFSYYQYRISEGSPILSQISRLLAMPPTSLVVEEIPECDVGERRSLVSP